MVTVRKLKFEYDTVDAREKMELNKITGPNLTLCQTEDNLVYFPWFKNNLYEFCSYTWNGPNIQNVLMTDTDSKENGKIKRKGRVTGAIIGTILLPGVGTAIGAMAGTGNKKKKGKTETHSVTYQQQKEYPSRAVLTLKNIQTSQIVKLPIKCDTAMERQLSQFVTTDNTLETTIENSNLIETQTIENKVDPYEELKKAKELFDLGILSQDEYEEKKKALMDEYMSK